MYLVQGHTGGEPGFRTCSAEFLGHCPPPSAPSIVARRLGRAGAYTQRVCQAMKAGEFQGEPLTCLGTWGGYLNGRWGVRGLPSFPLGPRLGVSSDRCRHGCVFMGSPPRRESHHYQVIDLWGGLWGVPAMEGYPRLVAGVNECL